VLKAPALLVDLHDVSAFDSGEESLDTWLRKRARANQIEGASRTFVACDGNRIVGYYAISSGAVIPTKVPGRFKRNMPDPIPVALLGRLAVDKIWQGKGLGRSLFRDAATRIARAADHIGIRGIVVHAISESAREFYLKLGFTPCADEPMTLVIALKDLRAVLPPSAPETV
jgi:predicted N-acetyltransferase YhbS